MIRCISSSFFFFLVSLSRQESRSAYGKNVEYISYINIIKAEEETVTDHGYISGQNLFTKQSPSGVVQYLEISDFNSIFAYAKAL